jgi:hypothetical protein
MKPNKPEAIKFKSYDFYKSIFDRELKRRFDLENLIMPHVTILSFLLALMFWTYNQYTIKPSFFDRFCEYKLRIDFLIKVSFFILLLVWIKALYHIAKSAGNSGNGFKYMELPTCDGLRRFEENFGEDEELNLQKTTYPNFENYLLSKMIDSADSHIKFNDLRSRHFHHAKKNMLIVVVIEIILIVSSLIKNI